MLGHTSAKMTLDTYADLFDDDLDAVAVYLRKHPYRISAGGGTRTLHSYLISELKTCRPVQTRYAA
jgi:hypothetical protein